VSKNYGVYVAIILRIY